MNTGLGPVLWLESWLQWALKSALALPLCLGLYLAFLADSSDILLRSKVEREKGQYHGSLKEGIAGTSATEGGFIPSAKAG